MADKKENKVDPSLEKFQSYFQEDIDKINAELDKTEKYSQIIDDEITKFSDPSVSGGRGVQHYLIEHIKNALTLQTQRQSLRKDIFSIKKTILDYSMKGSEESSGQEMQKLIQSELSKLRSEINEGKVQQPINSQELDDEIDRILEEDDNK